MSKYAFKYGVMTGDDFELVENYQSRLLSYINDTDIVRLFTQTSVTTTNWGYVDWIDGAFCAPYSFFKRINFELFPIVKRRNQMSSGVGQQMSKRLNSLKFSVKNYGSLIIHNGNDDSKMHPTLRKRQPLETDLTNIDFEIKELMISTSVTPEKVEPSENVLDILRLKNHIPDSVLLQLPLIINKFNCNSIIRLSHLLSHYHYDTNGFNKEVRTEDPNLKYITKKQLNKKVFNHLQILSDSDYVKFGNIIGKNLIDNPSLVTDRYSLVASGYIFNIKNLWDICDFGINEIIVSKLTKRIYGDSKSVPHRYELFKKYYNILK